jgi:hypothetical protein
MRQSELAEFQIWIADPNQRPTTVKELKDQMDAHNVCGTVAGPDSRPVQIRSSHVDSLE